MKPQTRSPQTSLLKAPSLTLPGTPTAEPPTTFPTIFLTSICPRNHIMAVSKSGLETTLGYKSRTLDKRTNKQLLRGLTHNGLNRFPQPSPSPSSSALLSKTASFSSWHRHLSHPSSPVVSRILRRSCLFSVPNERCFVCPDRAMAKAHRLPYPSFSSAKTRLLIVDKTVCDMKVTNR